MQKVSARYLEAVRKGRTSFPRVTHRNLVTGKVTSLQVHDGETTIDVRSKIRRNLRLTVPVTQPTQPGKPYQFNWDVLDTPGGEITVTKVTRYVDGETETVPIGVFIVDQDTLGYGTDGTIQLTCPDRWLRVQRNGFGPTGRASVPGNTAWQEIKRLVEGAFGSRFPGWAHLDTSATTKVGSLQWDLSREDPVSKLCVDNGLEAFFDATGLVVLQPIPALSTTSKPVWTVDAGNPRAVMIDGSRARDRSQVRNAISLTTSATDVLFDPVEVKNTTAGDPYNVTGPLGAVWMEYSSASYRNSAQARTSGLAMLARTLGVAQQLTLTAFVNDALDGNDVIRVVLPKPAPDVTAPVELHILDSLTVPLTASGTQDLTTRSTRPDTDGT